MIRKMKIIDQDLRRRKGWGRQKKILREKYKLEVTRKWK